MRPWFLAVLVGVSAVPGCLEPAGDVLDSVVAFVDALCEGNVEEALWYVHDPVYLGAHGAKNRSQVAAMLDGEVPEDPTYGPASAMLRTEDARILRPTEVETEYDVSIAEAVPGYEPHTQDRYVLVPRERSSGSDDPVQAFWRPSQERWVQVALFG